MYRLDKDSFMKVKSLILILFLSITGIFAQEVRKEEDWKKYDKNGKLLEVGIVTDSVTTYTKFHSNGKESELGKIYDFGATQTWEKFDKNGNLIETGKLSNEITNYILFYPNGKESERGTKIGRAHV